MTSIDQLTIPSAPSCGGDTEMSGIAMQVERGVPISSDDIIVSIENIHKTYLLGVEGVPALRGVSLDVRRGEFLVIYGTSGGGKTTLLNIIGSIDKPTKGNIEIGGKRVTARTTDAEYAELRLSTLGFVFQTFNLLPTMTVLENVLVPMVLADEVSTEEKHRRAMELLEKVGLGQRVGHYPSMLSGGEQQRATIARAMANRPKLLLLDEPTGDLDTFNTKIVMDLLLKLNRDEGVTLVMVTHDPDMKWYADRAVYVQDGKIASVIPISEVESTRARVELLKQLQSGGTEPGGLDSAVRNDLSAAAFNPECCPLEDEPEFPEDGINEIRQPTDYSTYHPRGLVDESSTIARNRFASEVLGTPVPVNVHSGHTPLTRSVNTTPVIATV